MDSETGAEEPMVPASGTAVKRRGLLKIGTLISAFTGASAVATLGASPAVGAPPGDNKYVPLAEKGAPSGVATLDSNSKIPPTYMPDLSATYGRSINVRSKGALLDGVTNDAPAFQSAINSAATFGLSVYFPPGTANLGASLIPKSGVALEGEGGSSVFTASTEIGAAIAGPTENLSDFTVRNVTFRGGATDLNQPRRRERPASSSFSQAIRIVGSGYNGVVARDTSVYPTIKNITLDNVRILSTKTLPVFLPESRTLPSGTASSATAWTRDSCTWTV